LALARRRNSSWRWPIKAPAWIAALAGFGAILTIGPAAGTARAQTPAQIQPDRPDVTNGAQLLDKGRVQLEIGGILTRDAPATDFASPFTIRVGVFDWLEARTGGDGLLLRAGNGGRESSFGNVQLGAKVRLIDEPGHAPRLSILPAVNIPTAAASRGFGSGAADYTATLLTGTDVGRRAHVDVNYGIGSIGAGGGAPHFVQHVASISASVTATPRWSPYLEAFAFSREEPRGRASASLDGGAIDFVSPTLALDGGVQVGLSRGAPDVAVFAGLSVVVGDLLRGHRIRPADEPARSTKRTPARRAAATGPSRG
jgi:hypothetical protein